MDIRYKRVLLKISGEALAGKLGKGYDGETLARVAKQIADAAKSGAEVAVVVGGGNFWRGRESLPINRTTSDYMGMLATVINSLALQDAFERNGIPARVQTAIEMREVAEPYIRRRAISEMNKGSVVIFGAGTGNPFFSTDTTAALRAAEIEAHQEVLEKDLKVMDSTAASICRDNKIMIHVFGLSEPENVIKAVCGEKIGTFIY